MRLTNCDPHRIRFVLIAGLVVASVWIRTNCNAQTPLTPPTEKALNTAIHVTPGTTTLQALLGALTTQTGIVFAADAYLLDRQLTISSTDQRAYDILVAVTELNEWNWVETQNGQIIIRRATPERPMTVAELPSALRRCLSPDIRRYLGIAVSAEDIVLPASHPQHEDIEARKSSSLSDAVHQYFTTKVSAAQVTLNATIFEEVTQAKTRFRSYGYSQWSKALRKSVLQRLVLMTLAKANSSSMNVWLDGLLPFEGDPTMATVRLEAGSLLIGGDSPMFPTGVVYHGFGLVIPEEVTLARNKRSAEAEQGK